MNDGRADTQERRASSNLIERFFRSRLRLSQLRLLVAIDDLSQLTKVAEWMHISVPAVSKQVAEIEAALEHKLLRRVGNKVVFTELGALIARRAREVLDQIERMRGEVDEFCAGLGGKVGVGAVPTVAPLFLPGIVMNFKLKAPNTAVVLQEGAFDALAPMLEEGSLDVVLAREIGHHLWVNFDQETVLSDPLTLVCGAQHSLAAKASVAWDDLRGVPWLIPVRGTATFFLFEKLCAAHGLEPPSGSVESISLSVNTRLLQSYPFVGLMPLGYAKLYQRENPNRIVVLPISTDGMLGEIKAVWRRGDQTPATHALLEQIRQQARLM